MKRISTATRVTDKFGPGKAGFTNGNAATGIPATDLEGDWFDHVQEEVARVIEAAGIAVDGSSYGQLLAALNARYTVGNKIQSLSASVAANALTVQYVGGIWDFRNTNLASGAPHVGVTVPANSITIPSGATLGTVSGQPSQLVFVEYYSGGNPVAGLINLAGGAQLDETNLVSPTTISNAANSANTFYSASAVAGPTSYRVVGLVGSTQATAGTWATAPSQVQGVGGLALAAMASIGNGQTWQSVTRSVGVTYYNTTGRSIQVNIRVASTSSQVWTLTVTQAGTATALQSLSNNGIDGTIFTIIPPGAAYTLTGGTIVNNWNELR